jgi:hypothetical protein
MADSQEVCALVHWQRLQAADLVDERALGFLN